MPPAEEKPDTRACYRLVDWVLPTLGKEKHHCHARGTFGKEKEGGESPY